MQTPWGELPVSDAHVHFFSPGFFSAQAAQCGRSLDEIGSVLGWRIRNSPEELAEDWKSELDAHGVARAALIASVPGDEDSVASAITRYPERFYGYFMANPVEEDSTARVQRALDSGR